ncbi:hypothetical protein [Mucilaginibacter sp.]
MEQEFEAILTGSDSAIEGNVRQTVQDGVGEVYKFTSVDDTLHLSVAKDGNNQWVRVAGTDPYLSGWVDELAEQIEQKNQL